ncbi:MAG: hypothetical protein HY720_10460 [Planctomycetes bacterium]|nr:hypothetical protein [Planctomycetota bacterium]
MSKPASRIGSNPLDFIGGGAPSVRPVQGGPEPQEEPEQFPVTLKTYRLPVDVVEKVADVAHAERCTMADFVTQAIRELVARIEERRGEPYPPRPKVRPRPPSTLEGQS